MKWKHEKDKEKERKRIRRRNQESVTGSFLLCLNKKKTRARFIPLVFLFKLNKTTTGTGIAWNERVGWLVLSSFFLLCSNHALLPLTCIWTKQRRMKTEQTNHQPLSLGVNLLSREGNSQDGRMKGEKSQKDKRIWREASEVRALFTNSLASFVLFSLFIRSCVLCFSFLLSFSSCFTSLPLQLNERKKRSTMTQQVLQIEDLLCVFFVPLLVWFNSVTMEWNVSVNWIKPNKEGNNNTHLRNEWWIVCFLSLLLLFGSRTSFVSEQKKEVKEKDTTTP